MLERLSTLTLRQMLTVMGLASLLALGACGGGSGAPNNPYDPVPTTPPLLLQPSSGAVAYSGIPLTLSVTSGVPPYQAFSQDSTALPVTQNVPGNTIVLLPGKVTQDYVVKIDVQDAILQRAQSAINIKYAPIFNSASFQPSAGDCGGNLCSGQNGAVSVIATAPTGVPLPSRQIRFDIVNGPIGFITTNPATPLVQTITVATDSFGKAVADVQAQTNATTQPAQIRATEVTSGQSQVVNFNVVNNTVATGSPLAVIPASATITSALTTECSTGFRIDYYVYGGNPPYTVSSTFPASVVLVNTTVAASGGYFEAITNGKCVDPLVFTIVDSAGKQVTSSLVNKPGAGTPPVPSTLAVAPVTVTGGVCTGKTFRFVLSGGSPSYNVQVSPTGPVATPQVVGASGGYTDISGPFPSGATIVTIVDAGTPTQVISATITCT